MINLNNIISIKSPNEYKIHLANWNQVHHPLDIFVFDKEEWKGWNSWRSERDGFNREYIFSFIDFYPETDICLFGGIFQALNRSDEKNARSYDITLTDEHK